MAEVLEYCEVCGSFDKAPGAPIAGATLSMFDAKIQVDLSFLDELIASRPMDTPLSAQFAHQWRLRMMAQEGALKEEATSKLRRLLAYDRSLKCTDVRIGDAALLYEPAKRKSTPRWRSLAKFMDIDDTGVTAKLQPQAVPTHPRVPAQIGAVATLFVCVCVSCVRCLSCYYC